jgi:hypothetical protein
MAEPRPVILIEFNELTPRLMDRWIAEGKLPSFARFRDEAQVYRTDAEESGEALNPWIQWVTVHTGVPLAEHKVFHLNDTDKLSHPQVWDLASAAGHKVWVCGSMNARYRAPLDGFVLPDAWSEDVEPYPAGELDDFYRFVQRNVHEYTKGAVAGSAAEIARFGAFMLRHGLSPRTVLYTLRQLYDERRTGMHRWRRATVMDRLQLDVFRAYYRRHRPALSTFFLNSTAHLQHMYWRSLEPEQFEIRPTDEERADTEGAILYGYQAMDELLGRIVELAGDHAHLLFVTALSQQPYVKADATGGKRYYRLRDGEVMKRLGVTEPYAYEPVMADNFFLRFDSEAAAERAAALVPRFTVDGEVAIKVDHRDGADLFLQCRIRTALPRSAQLVGPDGQRVPFYDVMYLTEGLKSGYHHPAGMLWLRSPSRDHAVHGTVALETIAPTVLELLGVPRPDHMRHPPLGAPAPRGAAAGVGAVLP